MSLNMALKTLKKDLSRGSATGVRPSGTYKVSTCGNYVGTPAEVHFAMYRGQVLQADPANARRTLVDVLAYHLQRLRRVFVDDQ